MTRKISTHRKNLAGRPLEASENVQPPVSAAENTLSKRKAAVITGKEAADLRKEAADRRKEAAGQRRATADVRKDIAGQRTETADQREDTANLREDTANLREDTADLREDTADLREDTADLREDTADLRQDTADLRQETADLRQVTADQRQDTADLRQEAADLREETGRAIAEHSVRAKAQLLEANENLVVATVRAQAMTEAAEKATEQMAYMAEHDFLTGLPNRALLTDRLMQSMVLAKRHGGKKVALMYLDLDHFKHINDSLGHEIGDRLLQSAARRLQECVRLSDTVSRHGGDEFVILLAEVEDVLDAVLTAEKLIKAMAKPHLIGDHQLHVTLSIGISLYPDDGKDVETVIRNADTAMYHAKKTGRNKYQVFTPDMNTHAVARQSIEQALHRALEQHEFVLHYQPKVNLVTGAIIGAEALLRWQRFAHRLVRPAQFVSIAEECGLIQPIGRWVLHETCRQTQAWLQAGLNPGLIAVNVSAVEFHGNDFLAGVHTILGETGLDPHHLEFELTESGLMQDTEQTTEILCALKNLGVKIAIDDFGTGYSSLSYLWRFPIDELKIDQSFVQAINGDAGDAETIVSAVIAMGASLKQRVVAEGIETRNQLAFLQSHHCPEGQGYYFGQPVPAEEFATLLTNNLHKTTMSP
ncbi:MAG: EAL domain-containing protein [Oryzomonas sp.]|uniref:putative bifunctional diguanylate cyclase/phosphodiesterase n=1 Tax=Oryzomonas sp. TaxID=2855186 RepID=UPI00283B88FE|nr:EAL domain-containing protein [Oryzomonas sp.]MDR3578712.1 EAL domain-containing protein [Oryzomonas sp.]